MVSIQQSDQWGNPLCKSHTTVLQVNFSGPNFAVYRYWIAVNGNIYSRWQFPYWKFWSPYWKLSYLKCTYITIYPYVVWEYLKYKVHEALKGLYL